MAYKVILFVDDDIAILNNLKTQFREEFGNKFIYELAQNGEEGLEIISMLAERFNEGEIAVLLVVSDWLMPGLKGDEFLNEANKRFPQAKKVLLTGHADEKAVKKAKENATLDKFLSKPWDPEELFQMVRAAIKKE